MTPNFLLPRNENDRPDGNTQKMSITRGQRKRKIETRPPLLWNPHKIKPPDWSLLKSIRMLAKGDLQQLPKFHLCQSVDFIFVGFKMMKDDIFHIDADGHISASH